MPLLPVHDDNPTRRVPVLTIGLIAINVAVFLWQQTLPVAPALGVPVELCEFGAVPDNVIGGSDSIDVCAQANAEHPAVLGLITSQFLHGDWLHLGGNMLFLWLFGNNIEDRLGRVRFLPFYLLGGAIAALVQSVTEPQSTIPLIGASGAIAAVLGAYLLLFPRARIFVFPIPFRLPAWLVLGLWIAVQFVSLDSVTAVEGEDLVAYWAHIGGFIAGFVLITPALIGRRPPGPPSYDTR